MNEAGRFAVDGMQIDELVDNFSFLDDWEDRYRYLIELGRGLDPLDDSERTPATKVRGCASQVWLISHVKGQGPDAVLGFRGDSDAHIVRGLIAVLFVLYSERTAREILTIDEKGVFVKLGLNDHLTPQRSNGLASMVARIKRDALAASGTETTTTVSQLQRAPQLRRQPIDGHAIDAELGCNLHRI